jgi:hypothetical protein
VRIKALSLSQSKHEKRTKGVITIQRGKDSWNQRPQTLGSLTPPLTRDPRTRARLHAHHHRPRPLCSTPTTIIANNTVLHPCRTRYRVAPTPSPLLRNRTPTLAYKTPPPAPSVPIPSKTHLIKPLCQIASNSIFPLPRSKITMLGDSWVEDCCTWFIVFSFLQCVMVILFDRILQWEEQREIKGQ